MKVSRRAFLTQTAGLSTIASLSPGMVASLRALADGGADPVIRNRFPSQREVWNAQLLMNNLGPRYTGNAAHRRFEAYLSDQLTELRLPPDRLKYTLPRWEASRWGLKVQSVDGSLKDVAVASYYPYSGITGAGGVAGTLVYAGTTAAPDLSGDLKGKILLLDSPPQSPIQLAEFYPTIWGFHPSTTKTFPVPGAVAVGLYRPDIRAQLLEDARKAGAAGMILSRINVSDDHAAHQYEPFSRPYADMPCLWVGQNTGAELRRLAAAGATMTLTLDAAIIPDSPTETLISTLDGTASDEVIIVNTHTDGPNAVEENGPIALLALAKYFSRLPKASRRRSLVFVFATGHMAEPYTPSAAWMKERPDIVGKAVAGVTIEHLGCQEWVDDASHSRYQATGQSQMAWAFCPRKPEADIVLDSLREPAIGRVAIVDSNQHLFGLGAAIDRAGVPEIAYISIPTYLLQASPTGCIEKVDSDRLYAEILTMARTIHQIDKTPSAGLKGAVSKSAGA